MHTTQPQVEVLTAGELEIRPSEHLARARGRTLPLSVRELDLLAALARREGRVVAREELYETVWGTPLRDQDRSVDVYVHKLRTKLTAAMPEWGFIHTHFGFGYRFEREPSRLFHRSRTSR
jgi:DNA-binding response OmpR family regulator